ncbi:MAG: hypothetical protein ACYCUG_04005 [Acidimicrobiales bacterium]
MWRRALVGGGVLGVAAGAAAVAFAAGAAPPITIASSSGSAASKPPAAYPRSPVRRGAKPVRPVVALPWWGDILHATYTIQTGTNAFQTYDVQQGTASGITDTSITVTSPDGFATTYVVAPTTVVDAQRDGILSIQSGNEVDITATATTTTSGTATTITATATEIVDITQVGNRSCWGPPLGVPAASGPASSGGRSSGAPGAPTGVICPAPLPVVGAPAALGARTGAAGSPGAGTYARGGTQPRTRSAG